MLENFVNGEDKKDGDRYYLQYRTQRDDKVRPEHAALDRVTLPITDSFWEEFYPPNGWNCRCNVVQVLKSKHTATDHDEAMRLGDEALQRDTKGMFRFNPGKEEKSIPDYNPYTIRKCNTCPIAKGGKSGSLARFIPENSVCQACQLVRSMLEYYTEIPVKNGRVRIHSKHGESEAAENISIAKYLAEKHGYLIDLLPNPNNKKSADTYNHTLNIEQEFKVNSKPTKSAIDNEIRKAAKQADSIVIRVDSEISLGDLRNGICGRINRCPNVKSVTVIRNNLDVTFSRELILKPEFQIKQEDFK